MYLPRNYEFADLKNPVVLLGPIASPLASALWGYCMLVECETPLYFQDMVVYDGELYVVTRTEETQTVEGLFVSNKATLWERKKWLERTAQSDRLPLYSFPASMR